jgi:hypothetical protein
VSGAAQRRRATSLSPPDRFLLDQWAEQIAVAFGHGHPYLVGSVARAESYRDVDVRLMLPQDAFDTFTVDRPRLRALNVAFSTWGQKVTGLPIDFQFQNRDAREGDDLNGMRWPIGVAERLDIHRAV